MFVQMSAMAIAVNMPQIRTMRTFMPDKAVTMMTRYGNMSHGFVEAVCETL
jgi:hypothetical protein